MMWKTGITLVGLVFNRLAGDNPIVTSFNLTIIHG